MNLRASEAAERAKGILNCAEKVTGVKVVLAPPFTSLHSVGQIVRDSQIGLAAQNFHFEQKGAFTGEISSEMIKEAGCEYAIIGHSERRYVFGEKDEWINKKIHCALEMGITGIVCVGETIEQRRVGETFKIIENQISKALEGVDASHLEEVVIAYEPVWAIGTGENATADQAAEVHEFIRSTITNNFSGNKNISLKILYGGSVTPKNSGELLHNEQIDGALVGGASLNIDSFCDIISSAQDA